MNDKLLHNTKAFSINGTASRMDAMTAMTTPLKRVVIILNPASGPDVPVLAQLNRSLQEQEIVWELLVTKKKHDAVQLAQRAVEMKPDAIIVCGGDGTIAEVASVVYQTDTPLVLLPGGTANIMVKELGVPADLPAALLQLSRPLQQKMVDIAVVNDHLPMCLRIEVGVMADIILATKRQQKEDLGPLAYPLVAVQKVAQAEVAAYHLILDGVKEEIAGVGLMITNVGNIGLPGISVQPDVSCSDGLLDIFVLTSADIRSLLSLSTSTLMGAEQPPTLKHWKARDISVTITPEQQVLCDDHALNTQAFHVTMSSNQLKVLV